MVRGAKATADRGVETKEAKKKALDIILQGDFSQQDVHQPNNYGEPNEAPEKPGS